jgi:Uma2 family endonuclease
MSTKVPRELQRVGYERAALEYLLSLPPEHFMESTAQSTQRAITVESLALVEARRPDFHVFNELLVQYPRRGQRKLGQVVPDNMVVITDQPIEARNSYNVTLEPARPYWTLEYVSPNNPRKDYEDSFHKYERELKVPYYLIFRPDQGSMILYRHNRRKYTAVKPNGRGRYPLRKLELEVALLEGWVRFWYQGKLLELPGELQKRIDELQRRADEEKRRADDEKRRADDEKRRADDEKRRADDEKRRADELHERLVAAERELATRREQSGPAQR